MYGVDVHSGVLHERPGTWLRDLLTGLLSAPGRSRLHAVLAPPPPKTPKEAS